MSYIHGYDPETLREIVNPDECRQRLDDIGRLRSLPALLERVWLLKVLDEPDDALAVAEQAVRTARMAGTRQDLLRARVLHATILQVRGALEAAELELNFCVEEADGQQWTSICAFALQHRGKVRYEAGNVDGARADFKRCLFLRQELGASEEQLEHIMTSVEATERRRPARSVVSIETPTA